ncbi:hypothetical protein LRS74_16370 [Streptomyces sp. LX-29]|uniref:hypothetical protein n=1 Tax=unclassified Streptomyces TaxID=2593676 RepID=UPI001185E1E4|nr:MULTISPECIES: hypothetical protein [unclassified Streptomyces]TVL92364.1 hypothetical protein CD790_11750 [Streptomyces sp. SAJ15]WFB08448.1 hypothetical protein LRS74_16370 [Streptomyces sp. LX-29]
MAQAARTNHRHGLFSLLDTDGKPHPLENTLAVVTLALGAVAFITAQFDHLHLLSSWTGLVGIGVGLWGQMISATTGERFLLMIGLGASGVGFYLGLAHGGLWGGVIG